ncbi:interferon regulatory factor 1 [Rhinophrynus dorsalis]
MPATRMRMRPWLESQINSNLIPGLIWINKEEMTFQIPWKHAARHGWDMEKDACLFRSWAIHTGRYKCGEKDADPKTWKANFRCAMNSLPDIKEVKDRSICKGSSAVRVYKMLPPPVKVERKERKSRSTKEPRSRLKKKSKEMEQEVVNNNPLPEDHSSYTASTLEEEEINIVNAAILGINESAVSSSIGWESQMEMPMPDSTNNLYPFQVSPITSSSEEEDEGINMQDEIFKILEQNSDWQSTNIDGKGYYTNESCTQNTCLTETSSAFDEMSRISGEIEVRFSTDLKTNIDLITWLDPNFMPKPSGPQAITCAL